jgi:hypothetical protein
MGSASDDRWHVRMAPGEVKVLTLDQIDDLFRLEMIDGDTLVRQDGTDQWLPLRVVAGLDDEASEPAALAPPPPQPSAPPPVRSAPPPVRSAPPPPPAPLPAPAAAPFTHSPSFVPPPASTAARSAPPSAPSPSFAPPVVQRIAPLPFTPPMPPPRPSRLESVLIGLAALLGLVLALQRNGTLATLFASAGQAAAYAKLEAALGGPAFGTPRAVDALTSQTRALPQR